MTAYKELTGEKREKFEKWLKQFQKENDRSPTIEEVYDEATKELEAQIEQLTFLHNEDVNTIKLLNEQIREMECCENCAFFKDKTYDICHRIKKLGTRKCAFYKMM